MAIARQITDFEWSSVTNVSVATSSSQTSDFVALDATAFKRFLVLEADRAGSASDAQLEVIVVTRYNVDGSDEYTTENHGIRMPILDCDVEDPARMEIPIEVGGDRIQLIANNLGATDAITFAAALVEITG